MPIHLISYPFFFISIQELWWQFSTDRLIKQLDKVMQGELVLIVNTLQAADDRKQHCRSTRQGKQVILQIIQMKQEGLSVIQPVR